MSTQEDTNYNRNYKDGLFRFIFNNKEAALSLYNAVNESDYQDSEELEIYTMNEFLYMGMKNDLSFLIDWNLNIFEHQSTYNPNMPLRGFIYTGAALRKYVELNKLDIYSSKRFSIPVPRYYVFYNGQTDMQDEVILKLTDSMYGEDAVDKSSAEFTARMININAGHSPRIMQRCPLLYQYSLFVARLRENIDGGLSLGESVEKTVDECIREGILERVLRANRAEVTNMLFKEYDSAAHIASEKDISYEEGLKAGIKEGRQYEQKNTAREKQRADNLEVENRVLVYNAQGKSKEDIAQLCNKPLEYIDLILNKYHIC